MAQEAGLREGGAAQAAHAGGAPLMLAGFVRYLEDAGLVEFRVASRRDGGKMDNEAMDNRIRLQALVLLANRFGLGSPYRCNEYNFGPSSSSLTDDAHSLSEDRGRLYDRVPASVPGSFRRGDFEGLVRGRDRDWLVAASTLVDMRAYRSTRELLIDTIRDDDLAGKPTYPGEYVSRVLDELEGAGLVKAYA